jgi:3-hydroxyacyl-CoA dehydrogenase/3-hydroxy-2-methylbutyryl-CoA dehydrogenase
MNAERGDALVAELGDAAFFCNCNVMEEDSIDAAVASAHMHFGALHGAVCCAGGQIGTGLTVNRRGEAFGMDKWWATVKLNAYGTFAVCSKVAAITSQQDAVTEDGEKGVLVNVASVAAQDGQDGQSAYSAGKGAIVAMTLPMARDLSRVGIRVNTSARSPKMLCVLRSLIC